MNEPDASSFPLLPDPQAALHELRVRAERRHLSAQSLPANTPPEVQRLVQELQVHQIELEMQYEELLLAQAEAEASRAAYVNLYEFAPIGYCTLSPDSTLQQLNLRACEQLGSVRRLLVGRRLALFIAAGSRHAFSGFLRSVLEQDKRQTITLEMRREDDTPFFARLEASPAPSHSPAGAETRSCHLALLDVTEQYHAQQALTLSERRFRILFEHNQDGMLLMRDNQFIDCNASALRLLGLTQKSELLGKSGAAFSPAVQPNGQHSEVLAQQYWLQALRVGHCRFEWCRYRASGEEFWEDVLLTAVPEARGTIVHAAWRDITAEKHAAAQVRESETRLQMALQASGSGVWSVDYATRQLHWDERAQQIFGRAYVPGPADLQVLLDAVVPEDRPHVTKALEQAMRRNTALDLEHRVAWPNGSIRYVSVEGKLLSDGRRPGLRFVGLMRDVTARHEAQQELNYKTRLLEHILANLPVILARIAPSGQLLDVVGDGLRRLAPHHPELTHTCPFASSLSATTELSRLLAGEQVAFVSSAVHQGRPVYFQNYGFFDQQRKQAVIFSIDITESEERRLQLQQEKEFTQNLLNNTIDAVAALDLSLCVTAWNARLAYLLGRSEADALGRSLEETLPGLARDPTILELLHRALTGEPSQHLNWAGYHQPMTYDLNFVPLRTLGTISGVLVVARDVTERNTLLAETARLRLRQQQEVLSAILTTQEEERRRIAEGLHNGVGQLLYATKLHLDNLPATEPTQASQKLLSEAIRLTRTISFELTPSILEDFGLKAALRELTTRIPAHSLDVDLNLAGLDQQLPPLLEIAVYRIMQELLNNVMKHASAREVFVQVACADDQLHLSVEDDGVGFDVHEVKQPKGIGLAGIRTRVELLGGTFTLRARPGKGTTVSITLPLTT
ncbi:PAS domain S-box protein [Hymenobacter lutimineralis]|uniref:histidine kinase n=1 Tax=Hymenobacter lutimineralis TaxID=2606448 RepID=A0A5D6V0E5_9BACT|nr:MULTISPECIES: PAS domain S-box protein [Hymenobacter]QIX61729.1 PAS domain S-box protein [Hymenobacter sp. BT18]TYZ09273.1 PAS domain S-box protein [Hymenobacter lutimineralis]